MRHSPFLTPLAAAALLAVAACGGGSDEPATSPPPSGGTPTTLVLSGTAASGAAIAGAPVAVSCATGSGSATTSASGAYSVTLASAVAPCLVQLTNGADTLHSLLEAGSASPATVNVTPLTTLLAARALGGDPATAFASFDAAAQAKLAAAAVATARADLTAALAGQVDIAGVDPVKTAFVVGDANDMKLDALQATLAAARVSLSELSTAVVANAGAPYAIRSYLNPAAAGCRSVRSRQIVLVSPFGFDTATVDAATLTSTFSDGSIDTLVDNGGCNFTSQGSGNTTLVSPGSVSASRFATGSGGQFSLSFGVPLQTVPVADLAGSWNYVGYARDPSVGGSVLTPEHGTLVFDAAGTKTSGTNCTGLDTCTPDGAFTLTPHPQGGFNLGFSSGVSPTDRVFVYRAPSGTMTMLFSITDTDNRGFYVATRQVRGALPLVGQVIPFSQFSIGSAGSAGAVTTNVSTTTAVDAAGGGSFTRTLSDGHAETVLLNTPRDGMRHRMAGSSPGSNGTPVSFNAVVQMRPIGVGMTVSLSSDPAQNFFNIAVDSPVP